MLFFLVSGCAILGLLWIHKFRLTVFQTTWITLILTAWGYAAAAGSRSTAIGYGAGLICLLFGYLALGGHRSVDVRREASAELRTGTPSSVTSHALAGLVAICALLTAYHFSKVGIPLFSSQVETQRFDFSSGLFGLPARTYLYGIPLTVLLCLRAYESGAVSRRVVWSALLLFLASRIASGFKSGLLEVLLVVLIAQTTSRRQLTVGAAARKYLVPFAFAGVFAVLVFQLYTTNAASGGSPIDSLAKRLTVGTAQPGVLAVESGRQLLPDTSTVANDTSYTLGRYAGIGDNPAPFAYSQLVSAQLYHTSLTQGAFVVPVTVGLWPTLLHDSTVPIALGVMTVIGGVFAGLERIAVRARQDSRYLVYASALLAMQQVLTKGNLVYSAVNVSLMAAFVLLTFSACCWVTTAAMRTNRRVTRRSRLVSAGI